MENNVTLDEPCFLRLHAVLRIMGLSRSSWYDGVRTGRFPKPVKLTRRTSAWRAADIRALVARLNGDDEGA